MFAESMKSDMKTWYHITMRPLSWQRSLKTSTLTMYHGGKMHMQIRLCHSPLCWPFQQEPRKKNSSTVGTCTAVNSPLKTVKLQEETFKSKKFLRLQQVSSVGIDDSLTSTSSYMAYCLTTPRRQMSSKRKLLDSITKQSCRYYTADRMMESCSDVFHTKRHRSTQRIS